MKTTVRALSAMLVLALGAASQLSCSVNDYCLNCEVDDGGAGDGRGGGDGDGGTDTDGNPDPGCVPTGPEECDGKDNDCNGFVDDGVLPMVGELCANQQGLCAGGINQCLAGRLVCSKTPSAEICDGKDNNCDGVIDDGDPGGGTKCGPTDAGDCVAGRTRCNPQTGQLDCIGAVYGTPEVCDGRDNDCNGSIDDNIPSMGSCGPASDDGICAFGTRECLGGVMVCQGAVFPKLEVCNGLDDDCDIDIDENFNTDTDPTNCGACGNVCPAQPNANAVCVAKVCGYTCKPGFHDVLPGGGVAAGCEYGPCFASGVEVCDGVDNDCDSIIDEELTPPSICRAGGECGAAAPAAVCTGASGWTCSYPGDVQFPETKCDGKDNDCDANTDEGQANLNHACDDGKQGACRSTGTFVCNAAMPDGPAVCVITKPGQQTPDAQETCDSKDNDCDGVIDEGSETGDLLGQEWVSIGGGVEIMKYEASRFDATSTQQGTANAVIDVPLAPSPTGATQSGAVATFTTLGNHSLAVGGRVRVGGVGVSGYNGMWTVASVPTATSFTATLGTSGLAASGGGFVAKYKGACSRPDVMPWTNVTYVEALAACESMGATLCTETRWHQACSVVTPSTTPILIDATNGTAIEAEDFTNNTANGEPESGAQCANSIDDDFDGRINDGCPAVITGVGPESGPQCANGIDDDNDGVVNDGCPVGERGTGPETGMQCLNSIDDDGDGRINDGCPMVEIGAGPETGAQCLNNVDDDGDGRVNDGCPIGERGAETGSQCANNLDDDGDGRINDGCPAVGTAETSCNNAIDNDNDGWINDGCPAVIVGAGAETGNNCLNNTDNDNDGLVNDGCPPFTLGAGPETGNNCLNATDNDGDGRVNDGCPEFVAGAGPETGNACDNATDNDGDGLINDGCPARERGAETGSQCTNNIDDDGDGTINDGCSSGAQAWIEDYTIDEPSTATNEQHSGIGNMRALPNIGAAIPLNGASVASPRLDYLIDIPTGASDWRVHVRMFSPTGSDDSLHVGIGPTVTAPTQTLVTSANSQWVWMSTTALTLAAGTNTLSLYMAEDGLKVDRIFIVRGAVTPPTTLGPAGGTWSYANSPTVYNGATCNGADRSSANDNILPTGSLPGCYADHVGTNDVFDMSGNVKEWTLARLPGQNPIRGGASNDLASGISCALNFTLGNDTFFFPNVGFRCCR